MNNSNSLNNTTNQYKSAIHTTNDDMSVSNLNLAKNKANYSVSVYNTGNTILNHNQLTANLDSAVDNRGILKSNTNTILDNSDEDIVGNSSNMNYEDKNTVEYKTNLNLIASVSSNKVTITVTTPKCKQKIKEKTIYLYVNGIHVAALLTNPNGEVVYTYTTPSSGIYTINVQLREYDVPTTTGKDVYFARSSTLSVGIAKPIVPIPKNSQTKTSLAICSFKSLFKKFNPINIKIRDSCANF